MLTLISSRIVSSWIVSFQSKIQSKHKTFLKWTAGWRIIATFKYWFPHLGPVNQTDWITLPAIILIAREIKWITNSLVQDPVSSNKMSFSEREESHAAQNLADWHYISICPSPRQGGMAGLVAGQMGVGGWNWKGGAGWMVGSLDLWGSVKGQAG